MTVSPPLTTAAKKYRSDTENVWAVEFHEAAGGTDVVLRKGTGAAAELDALWPLVERCG